MKCFLKVFAIIAVPFWGILYLCICSIQISEYCRSSYRCACITTRKTIRVLEFNPLIRILTKNKIMKIDLLDQKRVNQIYEAFAFLDFVFTKHKIKYVIDSGTELGAIRHGGFIPWDDDGDLIAFCDRGKLMKIIYNEIKLQKKQERFSLGRKGAFFSLDVKDGIFIDIFSSTKEYDFISGKQKYFTTLEEKWNFYEDEIFPIKKCNFGPLKLPCKNNPIAVYNKYYGDDWMTVAYTYNHTFNKGRGKKIKLTKELLKPALPNNNAWQEWVNKKVNMINN